LYGGFKNKNLMEVSIGGSIPEGNPTFINHIFDNIIVDMAHSLPTEFTEKIAVYSLYSTKPIAAGEGGIIVTDDKSLYEEIKKLSYHGIGETSLTKRSTDYDVDKIGYKFNMSDVTAAIALGQTRTAYDDAHRRENIYLKYKEAFKDKKYISFVEGIGNNISWHLALIRVKEKSPDLARYILNKSGIETSRHFKPVNTFTYYKEKYGVICPNAEKLYDEVISLPIYASLTNKEVNYIIKTVREAINGQEYFKTC
jgi:dTDP-4-amino-4,6-dideoxygalactose transaminase